MGFALPLLGEAELGMIHPDKWYSVKEVADFLGFGRDTVVRQVQKGHLKAFCLPTRPPSRRRIYLSRRILGAELLRYVQSHVK